jgi:hypothetical protein
MTEQEINMTADELTREIAKLCGFEYKLHPALLKEGQEVMTWFGPNGRLAGNMGIERCLPQYLTDANAALELLEEMNQQNCPHDENEGDYPVLTGCWKNGWRFDLMFAHHDGDAEQFTLSGKTFCEAVALGYYHWRTGNRVQLVDESEAL